MTPFFSPDQGRPTKELYAMLGALLFQQIFDLTDEETVSQMAFNLQWHYAVDNPEESDSVKYISPKTLWSMRNILTDQDLDTVLFEKITDTLAKVFDVDTSKQRIDSVHIKSNMRRLGRIGILVRCLHKFLVNLKRQYKELFETLPQELVEKYLSEKVVSCFSLVKPSKEIPSDSLQNPSDPDAGYSGHKGQGYQVQIMETYSKETEEETPTPKLELITHVQVESAHQSDAHALIPALEATAERGLDAEEVLADSVYGSDENCEAAKTMGVEVVSPVMGSASEKVLLLAEFEFAENGKVLQCPQGQAPAKVKCKGSRYTASFVLEECQDCPRRSACPVVPGKRHFYLRYDRKAIRLAKRRACEKTPEFRDRYRFRAGIEGTISAYAARTGVKWLRVRGLQAGRFCATLKATGVNLFRTTAVRRALMQGPEALGSEKPGLCGAIFFFKELLGAIRGHFHKFMTPMDRYKSFGPIWAS